MNFFEPSITFLSFIIVIKIELALLQIIFKITRKFFITLYLWTMKFESGYIVL